MKPAQTRSTPHWLLLLAFFVAPTLFAQMPAPVAPPSQASPAPRYRDASVAIADRVADLLARMTLEEKVAQLTSISLRPSTATEEGLAAAGHNARESIQLGIGQIENTFDPRDPRTSVELVNSLQRQLTETTRLGIPALIGSECLHGHAGYNSTVFPVPLAMASSWNPELVHQVFDIIGREARARGAHEAHTPVLDLGRDARWGRIEETYGEDTYLVTQMGKAVIAGLQGGPDGQPGLTHIISAPKHFAGYGQVSGGRNFAATPIETKTLFDEVLPPFAAAIKEVHAQGIMASHCDIGGVPAHGNHWLLTDLLKTQWSFPGMVVSDYNDIPRLDEFHHVVGSIDEAARLALMSGMDLDLPIGAAYRRLPAIIRKEPALEKYLDQSVSRILRLKFMLGLFEHPYTDADQVQRIVGQPAHVALAGKIAEESITLLKNAGGLLPLNLNQLKTIAVIGPRAATTETGGYSMQNDHVVSILEGIRRHVGGQAKVVHAEGCAIGVVKQVNKETTYLRPSLDSELPRIEQAVAAAQQADVAIVCVGGNIQTSMEAFYVRGIKGDRSTLGLLGNQTELVMRILKTGKPTIVVLMGGKPYSIPEIAEHAPAILNTFYLGQTNGTSLAKVLFGEVNPSGKLPITVPRSVGQLPVYYSQKAESFYKDYLDETSGPLFPFGFGLSYTTFGYSDLVMTKPSFATDETVRFSVKVKNTGPVAGAEVVQVYFRDRVATVVRPAKLLVRFAKVYLQPGEERNLTFALNPATDLAFTGIDLKPVVEPGDFDLMVGSSSADIRQVATFRLE
jgi:beta-glucosidase